MAIGIDRETDEGIEMEIDMRKHRHGHRQILSRRETPYVTFFLRFYKLLLGLHKNILGIPKNS